EIAGAIHGIDGPDRRIVFQTVEKRGIRGGGFFTQCERTRHQRLQFRRKPELGRTVGDSHQIAFRLLLDVVFRKRAKTRHDFERRNLPHQGGHFVDKLVHSYSAASAAASPRRRASAGKRFSKRPATIGVSPRSRWTV